jgi:hypothetical protein
MLRKSEATNLQNVHNKAFYKMYFCILGKKFNKAISEKLHWFSIEKFLDVVIRIIMHMYTIVYK